LLSDANMILQKNRQQICDAGPLAHMTVKSGVERATDGDRVVVAGQSDELGAGCVKVDFADDPRRADTLRLQVKEEHLRRVKPGQSNRLRALARAPTT